MTALSSASQGAHNGGRFNPDSDPRVAASHPSRAVGRPYIRDPLRPRKAELHRLHGALNPDLQLSPSTGGSGAGPGALVAGGPCPRQESNLVFDLRKVACASATLRGREKQACCRVPHPGIEPGPTASKAAVRPPHSRGNDQSPCQESNLVFDCRGARAVRHTPGRSRSRRPGSNRHEPAYKAGASPFSHVGGSRGARIRTLCAGFGGPLLSQEHAPVKGPGLSKPGHC